MARAMPSETVPWPHPDRFHLFISHTSAHKDLAEGLRDGLARLGVDGFVAHTAIEPASEWVQVIEHALRTCDAMLALLSKDFPRSRWCDQEVGVGVGRGILILPVRLGIDPYGFLGRYQGLTPIPSSSLEDAVFHVLARSALTRAKMADAIILRFVRSGSFDGTRAAWPYLAALAREAWTGERVRTVRKAALTNTQISFANLADGVGTPVPQALDSYLQELGLLRADLPLEEDEILLDADGAALLTALRHRGWDVERREGPEFPADERWYEFRKPGSGTRAHATRRELSSREERTKLLSKLRTLQW